MNLVYLNNFYDTGPMLLSSVTSQLHKIVFKVKQQRSFLMDNFKYSLRFKNLKNQTNKHMMSQGRIYSTLNPA